MCQRCRPSGWSPSTQAGCPARRLALPCSAPPSYPALPRPAPPRAAGSHNVPLLWGTPAALCCCPSGCPLLTNPARITAPARCPLCLPLQSGPPPRLWRCCRWAKPSGRRAGKLAAAAAWGGRLDLGRLPPEPVALALEAMHPPHTPHPARPGGPRSWPTAALPTPPPRHPALPASAVQVRLQHGSGT